MPSKVTEKQPSECCNIEEVRGEIDRIDYEIIRLISLRRDYVREVVKYKDATTDGIEASDRRQAVIKTRMEWAAEKGVSPELAGDIYNRMVQYFIDEEKKIANIK